MTEKIRHSFSGHESFYCKSLWLKKGYDFVIYNFYSYLSEVNADSTNWRAIRVALERVEGYLSAEKIENVNKIVKTIGLCNLFGNAINFDKPALSQYAKLALDIPNPEVVINELAINKCYKIAA
jgi:hypothetical protein